MSHDLSQALLYTAHKLVISFSEEINGMYVRCLFLYHCQMFIMDSYKDFVLVTKSNLITCIYFIICIFIMFI